MSISKAPYGRVYLSLISQIDNQGCFINLNSARVFWMLRAWVGGIIVPAPFISTKINVFNVQTFFPFLKVHNEFQTFRPHYSPSPTQNATNVVSDYTMPMVPFHGEMAIWKCAGTINPHPTIWVNQIKLRCKNGMNFSKINPPKSIKIDFGNLF